MYELHFSSKHCLIFINIICTCERPLIYNLSREKKDKAKHVFYMFGFSMNRIMSKKLMRRSDYLSHYFPEEIGRPGR